jgi:sulfoxide reductase heme-binding subunit YedZ
MDHTYWYLTRAAGLVAYLLLFASVVLGLVMTGDLVGARISRFRAYDLHRFVTLMALAATAFHALIVLPDAFIGFSLTDVLVPFATSYRPAYMAAGVFALWLMALFVVTFYLRPLVPYAAWRLLHYATFVAFVLAVAHGAGTGTDTKQLWGRDLYAATGFVVFVLFVYRVLMGGSRGVPKTRGAAEAAPGRLTEG